MKITKLLLTIILVIGCIFTTASCDLLESVGLVKHVHEFDSNWTRDENSHYKVCTVDGCTDTSEKASHSWGEPVITDAQIGKDGSKLYTCTVCKATKTDVIPALEHKHKASEDWISDADKHWNLCDGCDAKLNTSSHIWNDGTIVIEATSGKEGQIRYSCVVCERTKFESIPALPGKMSEQEWISLFDIDNVRIDAIMDVGGLVTTAMYTLIDGEYATVTSEGETYYSTSEEELSQIDFAASYGDFDHIGNNVYYAKTILIDELEISDVTVVVKDGKIESVYYTMNIMGFESTLVFTLSEWGNVTVEMPTLTKDDYESIQNPGKFHTYSLNHNFYKAGGSLTATYYVFEGDNYHATYYVDNDDFTESSGVVENAGIMLNGALAILRPLRAEDFVYDFYYNAFSYSEPDLYIKDTILYFGVVVEDGYLMSVYIEYKNGDYESYYFDYSEGSDDSVILTSEDYEALLDESKYYNYSYTYSYYENDTDYYMIWDYVIDGDTYVFTSISNDGYFTEKRKLDNAGVNVNHYVLSTLGYLKANDFVYDADSGEFVLLNLFKLDEATTEYFSITIEDGYLTSVSIVNSYGYVVTYTFYDYGISDVNTEY